MKYNIVICDDEQDQIKHIASIVSAWSAQNSYTCDVTAFTKNT